MGWPGTLEIAVLLYFALIHGASLIFSMLGLWDLLRYQRRAGDRPGRRLLSDTTYRPLSVLVPAHDEEEKIVRGVESLLTMGYPEFEVVVINDGSQDATLDRLRRAFALFPVPSATQVRVPSKKVVRSYRSVDHPNLVVLDKEAGGRADSLNAGINAASYPLLCTIEAGSVLEPDALLRISRAFAEDDRIIGAGGVVQVLGPSRVEEGRVLENSAPHHTVALCGSVELARSFLSWRPMLARLNSLLHLADGFSVLRKDAVIEVGGYLGDSLCEGLDLVARLLRTSLEQESAGRMIFVPDLVCWRIAPRDWRSLIVQQDRRQRALLRVLWQNRGMMLNPRYGRLGLIGMPYYALVGLFGPVAEITSYLCVLGLLLSGKGSADFFWMFLILAGLFGVVLSVLAVGLQDLLVRRYRRASDLVKMFAVSVLEWLGYRQLTSAVRAFAWLTMILSPALQARKASGALSSSPTTRKRL